VAAREDFAKRKVAFTYLDVTRSEGDKKRMIELSGGRHIPVIVQNGEVTVGFGGT
jgi:glutaredoxin